MSESSAQPQWSPDGQWWWDGDKWLAAADADPTALLLRPAADQRAVPAGELSTDDRRRGLAETKTPADERSRTEVESNRAEDERKQTAAAAKKIRDDERRLADDERKRAEAAARMVKDDEKRLADAERKRTETERKKADDEIKKAVSETRKADFTAKMDARRKGKMPGDGSLPMEKLHGRAQKLLEQGLGAGEPVLGRINGIDDTQCLVLTDQRAIIIKVGWRSGQTLGGKVTSFEYRNISSVEVRTSIITGTFEISSGGMQGPERSYYSANKADGAWHAPNTIPISKQQQLMFQQVATFIRERSRQSIQPVAQPVTTPDKFEQLKKLGELKEQGILTAEEFQSEKAKLLSS